MHGSDLRDSLLTLSGALTCRALVLRIECANLETVYASVEGGSLMLSDRRETFAWLERSGPGDRGVSVEAARAICAPHGVVIDAADPERFPRLESLVTEDEDVQSAVDRLAAAIDAIFAVGPSTEMDR